MNGNPDEPGAAAGRYYETALRRGFPWLRFPRQLEAQFHVDNFVARRRYLLGCAASGLFAIILAGFFDDLPCPDIPQLVRVFNYGAPLCVLGFLVPVVRVSQAWMLEALYAVCATIVGLLAIGMIAQSRAFTAYQHSIVTVLFICAVTVGARLRFWYAFASSSACLLGYFALMHGHTPLEQAVVKDNFEILLTSSAFVLFANYLLEQRERRMYLLRKLEVCRQQELEEAQHRLRDLAMRDPLTGVNNRRQFDADLAAAWGTAACRQQVIGLLLVDIDFFKLFNDGYGHPAGDACLRQVANVLRNHAIAHHGSVARFGGEEFAVLLPDCDEGTALQISADLCAAVREAAIPHAYSPVNKVVTVSVGVASINRFATSAGNQPCRPAEQLIAIADDGLYRAKTAGRDRPAAGLERAVDLGTVPQSQAASVAAHESAANPAAPVPVDTESDLAPWKHAWWKLRFSDLIEADYQTERSAERQRLLSIGAGAGALLFAIFLIHDIHLFPDLAGAGEAWLMAQVVFLAVLGAMLKWAPLTGPSREWVTTVSAMITGAGLLAILSTSEVVIAYTHAVVVILVLMQAGVGMRLPFHHVLALSYVLLACDLLLRRGHNAEQKLIELDVAFVFYVAGQFTVLASYQLERMERETFLLRRQERRQHDALLEATAQLRRLSSIDPLTGIPNRRQFESELNLAWEAASEARHPVSLLIVDVDHFKLYNDGYGHPAGDACLSRLATLLNDLAKQQGAFAARIGGEEFAILLPSADVATALRVGEQACQMIEAAALPHRYSNVASCVTVSIGGATQVPDAEATQSTLLQSADEALYRAKLAGRNRFTGMTAELAPPASAQATGEAGLVIVDADEARDDPPPSKAMLS